MVSADEAVSSHRVGATKGFVNPVSSGRHEDFVLELVDVLKAYAIVAYLNRIGDTLKLTPICVKVSVNVTDKPHARLRERKGRR